MAFAEGTVVPVAKTRGEIEALAVKYGAKRFASGWMDDNRAAVSFVSSGRLVRFVLPLPTRDDTLKAMRKTDAYRWRTPAEGIVDKHHDAELRRRWRCLLLALKAKLECVASGIENFEEAFLAHIVTEGNITVYERIKLADSEVKLLAPMEAG